MGVVLDGKNDVIERHSNYGKELAKQNKELDYRLKVLSASTKQVSTSKNNKTFEILNITKPTFNSYKFAKNAHKYIKSNKISVELLVAGDPWESYWSAYFLSRLLNRDIPIQNAVDVVNYFKNDYHIYQLGYQGQPLIQGCHRITLDTREVLASVLFSKKRLLIDSFSQHSAAAFGLKSVVCWVGNKPEILGYDIHTNVKPTENPVFDTYHSSYLDDFDIGGNPVQFPYDKLKIFDSNELINKILEL